MTLQHYVAGRFLETQADLSLEVTNPATEALIGTVPVGSPTQVGESVAAARSAFSDWRDTPAEGRLAILSQIAAGLAERAEEIGRVICSELGMPLRFATAIQAALPIQTFKQYAKLLKDYAFEQPGRGSTQIFREPIGVCGLITPWNFPLHQIAGKVAPALAAGCTVVLKPSEVTPLCTQLLIESIEASDLPAGVFNVVYGDGPTTGCALSQNPGLDMISFTGSTRAGVAVAKAAAADVKRVTQELGGKSPNIILDDAELARAVAAGVGSCFFNSGQACNAPTRLLVHDAQYDEAVEIAIESAQRTRVGDPLDPGTQIGPLVSATQRERVRELIRSGQEEGARCVVGGGEAPADLQQGYYCAPTVFADVEPSMRIAQEEIFGPVLCILRYRDDEHAIEMANDTPYGLSSYVSSGNIDRARSVGRRLRTGQVHLNGATFDPTAPFGGFKQSGNGREFGTWGLEEYLETQAILGYTEE